MINRGFLFWGGIRLRFHPLFSVMLLLSVVTGYLTEMLILFGIVLIHELGHAAAAKSLGWRIREIQLLPFGGVAETEELGTVPAWEEMVVAIAGPLQNAVMIVIALLIEWTGLWPSVWWSYFIEANLIIACFNLLPVLPLDGGKIVQCLMSYWMPYHRAILYCTWLSFTVSALTTIAALLHIGTQGIKLNLLVIGLFLLYSNWYAYRGIPYHFVRFLMSRELRSGSLLLRGALAQPIVVNGRRRVADILRLFVRDKYHLIYVIDESGRIHAVLPEQRLLHTYFIDKKPGCAVSELFM
ncbi:M50 family metallopeptidase [Paenibacillus thalictri]|nr:M50 family metallopeptidase [Paenibacillus thalictri]